MHLFHRWEVVSKREGEATFNGLIHGFRPTTEDVVVIVEECTKCHKKHAYAKSLDGTKHSVDLDFVERL